MINEWIEITQYDTKQNLMFAYKQREKYESPVNWLEKKGRYAVAIPTEEHEINVKRTKGLRDNCLKTYKLYDLPSSIQYYDVL